MALSCASNPVKYYVSMPGMFEKKDSHALSLSRFEDVDRELLLRVEYLLSELVKANAAFLEVVPS